MNCGHTFAWHSVLPPSHCPVCGACLHCHAPRPAPVMPYPTPYWPRPLPWWQGPFYSTTVHTSNVASTGTLINSFVL
jgi:hypothetical protein